MAGVAARVALNESDVSRSGGILFPWRILTVVKPLLDLSCQRGAANKPEVPSHTNSSARNAPYRNVGTRVPNIIEAAFSEQFNKPASLLLCFQIQSAVARHRASEKS
jgi:hypothetical protein